MAPFEIVPVAGGRDRESFVALPYELHRGDPGWPPLLRRDVRALLDPRRNPFFGHADAQLFLPGPGSPASSTSRRSPSPARPSPDALWPKTPARGR